MGIWQRKDTRHWEVQITIGGQRIRRSVASKREAQELYNKLRHEAQEAKHNVRMGRKPTRTFDEALARWLREYVPPLKSGQKYIEHARIVRQYLPAELPLADVPDAANKMRAAMLAKGNKPASVNQRLAVVRRVLNLAEAWGWIDKPLGRRIKLLAPHNERHVYLSREQIIALAEAAGEARDVVLQLAYTGLRLSELYKLTPAHVRDGFVLLDARTKSGKPRAIPMAEPIRQCPIPPKITRYQFRLRWERARAAIGMPQLHAHDLRHTAAYMLLQAGASLAHVRDWLGHSNLQVTNRYLHLTRDDLADIAKKLG